MCCCVYHRTENKTQKHSSGGCKILVGVDLTISKGRPDIYWSYNINKKWICLMPDKLRQKPHSFSLTAPAFEADEESRPIGTWVGTVVWELCITHLNAKTHCCQRINRSTKCTLHHNLQIAWILKKHNIALWVHYVTTNLRLPYLDCKHLRWVYISHNLLCLLVIGKR